MGVSYKLRQEVRDFIIEKKKLSPDISCRSLGKLIEKELKVTVSKSSINAVFKVAGLSTPVGRKYKEGNKPAKSKIIGLLENQTVEISLLTRKTEEAPRELQSIEPQVETPKTVDAELSDNSIESLRASEESEAIPSGTKIASSPEPALTLNDVKGNVAPRNDTPDVPHSSIPSGKIEPSLPPAEQITQPIVPVEVTPTVSEAAPVPSEPVEQLTPAPIEEPIALETGDASRFLTKNPETSPVSEPITPPIPEPPVQPVPEPFAPEKVELIIPEAKTGDVSMFSKNPETSPVSETSPVFMEGETSGAILLKAMDHIIGGLNRINGLIQKEMPQISLHSLAKTEALAYMRLFNQSPYTDLSVDSPVWTLINHKLSLSEIIGYIRELDKIEALPSQIYQSLPALFKEARGIKVVLSNGIYFYFDGQLHTLWSAPHIPFDFSANVYKLKDYINKYFKQNTPFVFFMAPGYDMPIKEFFEFVYSFDYADQRNINTLTIYGSQFEDLEVLRIDPVRKRHFVFGLWPWQFVQCRKINKIKEFRPFYFEPLKQEFYLAEVDIELFQEHANKGVTLRGCALKTNPSEKTRLLILTNALEHNLSLEQICTLYLQQWPNLEEGFQDYSRKIELFTYTGGSQRIFAAEEIDKFKETTLNIDSIFNIYLKMLDSYLRWHFMPPGYEDKDFSTMKEQFYSLEAKIKQEKDYLSVTFKQPAQPALAHDLEYLLRRLNELNVTFSDGKRLWFK